MSFLLDSSALIAFYFGEAGGERVRDILNSDGADVRVSVLTAAEFWSRLHAEGWTQVFDEEWARITEVLGSVDPVSLDVVLRSFELKLAATARLPQVDALIAATSALHGAVLVHRDPHFLTIPDHLLQQELLPDK